MMKTVGTVASRLEFFFKKGRRLSYSKDEIILGPFARPRGIYFIEHGFVKIYSINKQGNENIHIIYKPGEIFPFIWALKNIQHDVYYTAINDCQIRLVSRRDFIKHIKTSVVASNLILVQLANQLDIHIKRIVNLEYKRVNERVAHRLLVLAARFGKKRGEKITIKVPLTHQTIADSINMTRESVSREIERLEKQNTIEYSEHEIVINNAKKLAKEFN